MQFCKQPNIRKARLVKNRVRSTLFSSITPSNSLVSVSGPRRAFWTDTVPFQGLQLAWCVASGTTENEGHCKVCQSLGAAEVSTKNNADTNLSRAFVKIALLFVIPKLGGGANWLCWSVRTKRKNTAIFTGSSAPSQTFPGALGSGSSTPCLVSGASGKQSFSTSAAARTNNTYSTPSGAIMQRPPRSRPFDVCMSSLTILTG